MNIVEFENEYTTKKALYDKLLDVTAYQLRDALLKNNIKIHELGRRLKSPLSLFEKAQRKNSKDPFKEIHDIVGLRVVCLFFSDIEKICNIMRRVFNIIAEDDKSTNSENVFGYLGVHFIARLKSPSSEQKDISDLMFEIQVRTISQDAWAEISHKLDYKNNQPIPSNLRRDFYALSGLLYVADAHFDYLRNKTVQIQK
jgi:putative GTP pyrophosphokinase